MAEHGVATISLLVPHRRLRPRAADLPRPWNTTQPSPISATHIGKRLAGKLHEPFERAGGGRAISPTSPDSTLMMEAKATSQPEGRPRPEVGPGEEARGRTQGRRPLPAGLVRVNAAARRSRHTRFT